MNTDNIEENIDEAVNLFKALAHKGRLRVFCALFNGEKNVGELTKISGLGQSALSQHLALLRDLGSVKTRRDAQTIYYSMDNDIAAKLLSCTVHLYGPCGHECCHVKDTIVGDAV